MKRASGRFSTDTSSAFSSQREKDDPPPTFSASAFRVRARPTPFKHPLYRLKFVLTGETSAGKTSLVRCLHLARQVDKWNFNSLQIVNFAAKSSSASSKSSGEWALPPSDLHTYDSFTEVEPTIAADFSSKTIGAPIPVETSQGVAAPRVKLNLWDLSGHRDFQPVRVELYRPNSIPGGGFEPQVVLFLFDLTSRVSFNQIESWLKEVTSNGATPSNSIFCVVANKLDLVKADPRARKVSESEARSFCISKQCDYFEVSSKTGDGVDVLFDRLVAQLFPKAKEVSQAMSDNGEFQASGATSSSSSSSSSSAFSSQSQPKKEGSNGERAKSSTSSGSGVDTGRATKEATDTPASAASSTELPTQLETLTVKELKQHLARLQVSFADCFSKEDLVSKLKEVVSRQSPPKPTRQPSYSSLSEQERQAQRARDEAERQKKDALRDRISGEVQSWIRNKNLISMLNDIHCKASILRVGQAVTDDERTENQSLLLPSSASSQQVQKSYKRALLKIHPDKHDQDDMESYARATEIFKVVNAAFLALKDTS